MTSKQLTKRGFSQGTKNDKGACCCCQRAVRAGRVWKRDGKIYCKGDAGDSARAVIPVRRYRAKSKRPPAGTPASEWAWQKRRTKQMCDDLDYCVQKAEEIPKDTKNKKLKARRQNYLALADGAREYLRVLDH